MAVCDLGFLLMADGETHRGIELTKIFCYALA